MWEISENLVQVAFLAKSCCCAKTCHSWLQPPSGNGFAVLTCWVPELCVLSGAVPSPALHLSPVLCCSWGSLTYAILWLVQDIQYFTKTLSSGKQLFMVPRAACVCSFLPRPQTWCLLTPALEMQVNHCHCIPAGCSFHFSWHIKCGRWVFF